MFKFKASECGFPVGTGEETVITKFKQVSRKNVYFRFIILLNFTSEFSIGVL